MKNLFILIMTIGFCTGMSSCREKNTDIEHHSESGNVEDNSAHSPGVSPVPESESDNAAAPAQNRDTIGNNQERTAPQAQ